MSVLLLLLALTSALLTWNVYRPSYSGARLSFISFFSGWLTGELAPHHIGMQALMALLLIMSGALDSRLGELGLLILLCSWAALGYEYWSATGTMEQVEHALRRGLGGNYRELIHQDHRGGFDSRIRWRPILKPFPISHPEVECIHDIRYLRVRGIDLKLDIYRHRSIPDNCPTLMQVHGGGWVIGSRKEQGLPLMNQMASRGWCCISVGYRRSPHATFPEHLIDLKHALRWIKQNGRQYGANPDFLVVTGGSAGGHLASMLALTANDPEYQPGFEDLDTSVAGCVPFHGIYDFTDRDGQLFHDGMMKLLERKVMKASVEEDPEAYRKASPVDRLHEAAPPFFIIHGDRDTLAPVSEARAFVAALEETSSSPVAYAEVPGGQHAFDLFPSLRSQAVIDAVDRFLSWIYSDYLAKQEAANSDQDSANRLEEAAKPAGVDESEELAAAKVEKKTKKPASRKRQSKSSGRTKAPEPASAANAGEEATASEGAVDEQPAADSEETASANGQNPA